MSLNLFLGNAKPNGTKSDGIIVNWEVRILSTGVFLFNFIYRFLKIFA